MLNRRHRRGSYALAQPSPVASMMRRTVSLLILGVVLLVVGTKVLNFFGVGNLMQQNAVVLAIEGQGTVNVSIEGKSIQRAENNLKLYPGDRVETSGRAFGVLSFFDESYVRLDERSEVLITQSVKGAEESSLSVELIKGTIWVAVPTVEAFSGSILREIQTENMKVAFPSRTEAIVSPSSIVVFAADGLGVSIWLTGMEDPIVIGEGQQLSVPQQSVITGDPYRYRKPLDPLVMRPTFVEESRSSYAKHRSVQELSSPEPTAPTNEIIVVTEPQDGMQVQTSTVRVEGKVGTQVSSVRINGYIVAIDEAQSTFAQDMALPDSNDVSIVIEALAADGTVQEEVRRTIHRDRKPPEPPIITSPASSGQTYLTSRETIEIKGKTKKDIVGVEVNDYRLQLFNPGDDTWTYLANVKLDNFKPGENVYKVIAINKGGYKSEPAFITIVLGEGEEGVIAEVSYDEGEENTDLSEITTSDVLPSNVPMLPGTLKVVSPTEGAFHKATDTSLLIEGAASDKTHSVWVNDYRLQLYEPGKTFWNYIADTKLFTMRRGTNIYHIVARDSEGKILDEMEYTILLDPQNLNSN
ncbi:MAG: cadherin-like beta sandwich domain-containing protein [Patescibacteria group bacterium]